MKLKRYFAFRFLQNPHAFWVMSWNFYLWFIWFQFIHITRRYRKAFWSIILDLTQVQLVFELSRNFQSFLSHSLKTLLRFFVFLCLLFEVVLCGQTDRNQLLFMNSVLARDFFFYASERYLVEEIKAIDADKYDNCEEFYYRKNKQGDKLLGTNDAAEC